MADAPNSFEKLTHSGIFRINSKDDKNVSLSLDVYMGNASLVVFTGAGGKPWKLNLPLKSLFTIGVLLRKIRAEPRPCREPLFINEWVEGEGKKGSMRQRGSIGFGISEEMVPYIDVSANDLQGKHMFPIKPDGRYDTSNTSMSEKDVVVAALDYLIETFTSQAPAAIRLSTFKRDNTQGGGNRSGGYGGGGGNRGGGYNNNNGGGGNYGGNRQQSSTFSGPDVENDLHV